MLSEEGLNFKQIMSGSYEMVNFCLEKCQDEMLEQKPGPTEVLGKICDHFLGKKVKMKEHCCKQEAIYQYQYINISFPGEEGKNIRTLP